MRRARIQVYTIDDDGRLKGTNRFLSREVGTLRPVERNTADSYPMGYLKVDTEQDPHRAQQMLTKRSEEEWQAGRLAISDEMEGEYLSELNEGQSDFVERLFRELQPVLDKSVVKKEVTVADMRVAMESLDTTLDWHLEQQAIRVDGVTKAGYQNSLDFVAEPTGLSFALSPDDLAAIDFWERRWIVPALTNTLGAHRNAVEEVFLRMVEEGRDWKWATTEMRAVIDPTGTAYPRYFYERIARTETARVVEQSHLSAHARLGYSEFERLVVVDDRTDKDVCLPHEGQIYSLREAEGILPAHPNCRCTMTPRYDLPPGGLT